MRWAIFIVLLFLVVPAQARDLEDRYKNSPHKEWFNGLASGKGLCCSFADGATIRDSDVEVKNGHYKVRIPVAPDKDETVWVDVPDDAVLTGPNRIGQTIVWPTYLGVPAVRCFMPGALT